MRLLSVQHMVFNTQLRHKWNVLAVLDPSTRISLSVIEFTPVETKGETLEPWKLQGWLPLPDFQTIRYSLHSIS